jgi:hypothetical protein
MSLQIDLSTLTVGALAEISRSDDQPSFACELRKPIKHSTETAVSSLEFGLLAGCMRENENRTVNYNQEI